jgi:hypothetical protein
MNTPCNCKILPKSAIVGNLKRPLRSMKNSEEYMTYIFAFFVIVTILVFYYFFKK